MWVFLESLSNGSFSRCKYCGRTLLGHRNRAVGYCEFCSKRYGLKYPKQTLKSLFCPTCGLELVRDGKCYNCVNVSCDVIFLTWNKIHRDSVMSKKEVSVVV